MQDDQNNAHYDEYKDNIDQGPAPESRHQTRIGKSAKDVRLPIMAFLAGGLLVAGLTAVLQLSNKPTTPVAELPQPTATPEIIIANPDDEIIFHSTPAPVASAQASLQPTAQPTAVSLPNQPERVMYISGQSSNVRTEPGLSSQVLTSLSKNTNVMDSGQRKSSQNIVWAQIRLADGQQGWISANLLSATPISPPIATQTAEPNEGPTSPLSSAPANKAVAEASIRSRALRFKTAWANRDLATAETLMHNQFSSSEQLGKTAWLNQRKAEAAKTKSRSIEWQEVQVKLSGNNAELSAIQHYHDVFKDNQTYDSSVRIHLGLVRWSDGNWYIIRMRYSPA